MIKKIYYIAETNLENKSAYSHHVVKMCDAFAQNKYEVNLIIPFKDKKTNFKKLENQFLLIEKKPFFITSILSRGIRGFFDRIYFGFKTALYLKKKQKSLVLTRSIISSFFLTLFKIKHYLELHSELKSFTKILMINLGFIKSQSIKKKILISNALNKIFKFNKKDILVLHDGVDTKNFIISKSIKKFKTATYIGSFLKGRGIEIIIELAKKFPKINFELYGMKDKIFKTNIKNLNFHKFVNYKKVPNILQKSDILLMPYSNDVEIRAKNINTANYCSPLKMFDYLASGKIIISSKLDGICEVLINKQNAIIVHDYEVNYWVKAFNDLISNKFDNKKIKKNAILTAKKYSWYNRSNLIIKDYLNKT